jgi:hypothetical protein
MLALETHTVGDRTRVTLSHQTADEVAEVEAIAAEKPKEQ